MNKVYFAGGCFWCLSDYILSLKLDGIIEATVGYCGGEERDATYNLVKSQKTKHRETIEVCFDESKISLLTLLNIYSSYVDIRDKDGQYIDRGYSYTLALFYKDNDEKKIFQNFVSTLGSPAYISVEKFKFFVKAEEYHQHFGEKNPERFMEEILASHRTCHLALKRKT